MKKLLSFLLFFSLIWHAEAQVPKKVIVEHFTNTLCSVCASRNPGFYSNLNNQNGILHLSIHSSAPYSQCQLYQQNVSPSDTRRFYYNVNSTPALIINGFTIPPSNDYTLSSMFTPFTGQTTPISIRMEQQKYGMDSMAIKVIVKTEATHNLGTQKFWVGLAEDSVFYTGPNGESQHYDVFRSELNMTNIAVPANVGDSLVYNYMAYSNVNWDFDRIFAFAMLQNVSNKSVTQVEVTSPNTNNLVSGISSLTRKALEGVSVFPNPTHDVLQVQLESDLETTGMLYSMTGQLLLEQNFQSTLSLSLKQYPAGLYLLRLSNEMGIYSQKIVKQ